MSSKRAKALAGIEETPHASNREIGRRVGVSANTVMRARGAHATKPRGKELSNTTLAKLVDREPAVAEAIAKAMRTVIDFAKTRGKLLRSLASAPNRSSDSQ